MRKGVEHSPGAARGPIAAALAPPPGRLGLLARAFLLACLLSLAAPLPSGAEEEGRDASFSDPLEPLNRMVFALNEALDTIVLRPAAIVYGAVLPGPVRRAVRNAVRHLSLPFTFVNDVAQGQWRRSGETAQRFLLNTVVGFVGLYDVAEDYGLPHRSTDFGSTLASWGIGGGPYLVLPIAGPSNVRDAAGMFVQGVADPVDIAFRRVELDHMPLVRAGVATLDFRHGNLDTLDDIKANSLDYYAFIRTLYRQRRAFEVDSGAEMYLRGESKGAEDTDDDYVYPPPRPDFGGKEEGAEDAEEDYAYPPPRPDFSRDRRAAAAGRPAQ